MIDVDPVVISWEQGLKALKNPRHIFRIRFSLQSPSDLIDQLRTQRRICSLSLGVAKALRNSPGPGIVELASFRCLNRPQG